MPAPVKIPVSAGLDDVVFRRARAEPGAVMLRRRAPWGGWQDVTAGQFRAEVTALAPVGRLYPAPRRAVGTSLRSSKRLTS
jgi:hypothetical protein